MSNLERFVAYLNAYARNVLAAKAAMLSPEITLRDWKLAVSGRDAAVAETRKNFDPHHPTTRGLHRHPGDR